MNAIINWFADWIATEAAAANVTENMFLASQLTGLVLIFVITISKQFRKMTYILIGEALGNGLAALSMLFVGGYAGSIICFVAIAHSALLAYYRAKDKETPLASTIGFLIIYLACTTFTFKAPIDTITYFASITFALSIVQKKPSLYRAIILINSILWGVYDASIGAYTAIIPYVLNVISIIIAVIRYDLNDWKYMLKRNK